MMTAFSVTVPLSMAYPGLEAGLLFCALSIAVSPLSSETVHRVYRATYAAEPENRPMGVGRELYGRHRDGSVFPVELRKPLDWSEFVSSLTIIIGVLERPDGTIKRQFADCEFQVL